MRRSAAGALIALLAAGAVLTGSPAAHAATARTDLAPEILAQQNQERAARGLAPFATSSTLTAIAQEWAVVLADRNQISHRDISWVLANSGGLVAVGENLAASSETTGSTTNNLLNSPAHRQNMLNPYFDVAGVGVACTASGMLFVVVNYGQRSGVGQPSPGIPAASPQVVSPDSGSRCGATATTRATSAATTTASTPATTIATAPPTTRATTTSRVTSASTALTTSRTVATSTSRTTVTSATAAAAVGRVATSAAQRARSTSQLTTAPSESSSATASTPSTTAPSSASTQSSSASTSIASTTISVSTTSSTAETLAITRESDEGGGRALWPYGMALTAAACAVTGGVMVRRPRGRRSL